MQSSDVKCECLVNKLGLVSSSNITVTVKFMIPNTAALYRLSANDSIGTFANVYMTGELYLKHVVSLYLRNPFIC